MKRNLESAVLTSAAVWTGLGLASGLGYRELTRQTGFTGFTQLALAHTHALALGTTMLLVLLGLTRVFALASDRRLGYVLGSWNAGLGLTFGMLVVKGVLQVLGDPLASSKALAGVSGLGHMILTGSFVVLFLVLRQALRTGPRAATMADETAGLPA